MNQVTTKYTDGQYQLTLALGNYTASFCNDITWYNIDLLCCSPPEENGSRFDKFGGNEDGDICIIVCFSFLICLAKQEIAGHMLALTG